MRRRRSFGSRKQAKQRQPASAESERRSVAGFDRALSALGGIAGGSTRDAATERHGARPASSPAEQPHIRIVTGDEHLERTPRRPATGRRTAGGRRSSRPATAPPGEGPTPAFVSATGLSPETAAAAPPGATEDVRLGDLAAIGARLRAAREAAGLSMAEIVVATKIHRRHVEAIERGDLAALPSSVYAKGYVATYARLVGIDPASLPAGGGDGPRRDTAESSTALLARRLRGMPRRAPAAIILKRRVTVVGAAAAVVALLAVTAAAVVERDGDGAGTDRTAGVTTTVGPATTLPGTPPSPPAPQLLVPASADAAGARYVVAAPALDVVVTAIGADCWARVRGGDGVVMFEGTIPAGESRSFPGQPAATVRLGNPPAAGVTVNGVPLEIPQREAVPFEISVDRA